MGAIGWMLAIFGAALVLGLPIAVAIIASALVPILLSGSFGADVPYVIRSMIGGVDSFTLLALPLFMLSGDIMCRGGVSRKLFDVFALITGKRAGGMPVAAIITCLFFGAISGSGPATCAAVGAMVLPILVDDLGYDKLFCGALLSTAAGLAVIIPPSNSYVTICAVTGESIGDLMIAGIIPGCLIGVFLMGWTIFYCKTRGEDKAKIAANYDRLKAIGVGKILVRSIPAMLFPVLILGGIYGGVVTPTEAACVSVFYALFISLFVYRTVKIKDIPQFLMGACRTMAPITILLCGARAFAKIFTLTGAPTALANWVISVVPNKAVFLIMVIVLLFVIGMFMDCGPANVILAPIFLPLAKLYGMNSIHFLLLMVCCLSIGFVTPPFGMNLFVAAPMIGSSSFDLGRKAMPFIAANLLAVLVIAFVPWFATVLIS
ncbi:TRAP transporter large permease [Hominifimenecus sp. rT4P-3]|uniref:TRAP transporter large permease n=1 Tax=Hominifimenecus sp. rT4P-3 TaxID=3242979 RepID=UPI003DA43F06